MEPLRLTLSAIAVLFGLRVMEWAYSWYRVSTNEIARDGQMQAMWHERIWADDNETG